MQCRKGTRRTRAVVTMLTVTLSSGSGWSLSSIIGQCFPGRLWNSGPLVHAPNGCWFFAPWQQVSPGLSADCACLRRSTFVPPRMAVNRFVIKVMKRLLTPWMKCSKVAESAHNTPVSLWTWKNIFTLNPFHPQNCWSYLQPCSRYWRH